MSLFMKITGQIMLISFAIDVIWFMIWMVRELASIFFAF